MVTLSSHSEAGLNSGLTGGPVRSRCTRKVAGRCWISRGRCMPTDGADSMGSGWQRQTGASGQLSSLQAPSYCLRMRTSLSPGQVLEREGAILAYLAPELASDP